MYSVKSFSITLENLPTTLLCLQLVLWLLDSGVWFAYTSPLNSWLDIFLLLSSHETVFPRKLIVGLWYDKRNFRQYMGWWTHPYSPRSIIQWNIAIQFGHSWSQMNTQNYSWMFRRRGGCMGVVTNAIWYRLYMLGYK